jgi:hypothetical protein
MKYKVGDIVFSTIWKKSVLIKDIRPNRFYLIADLEYLSRTMITYESNLKSREDDIEKDMEEHQKIVDEIMTIQGIEPIEAEIEEVWHCPDGYIFKDENGNVINATKIVLEKKKKEYPKTYEECAEMLGECAIMTHGYKRDLLNALQKLIVCRDAYWKIAGEEMELGEPWEPDWQDNTTHKFIIHTIKDKIHCGVSLVKNHVLAFPTEEMRDAFKQNFDPDIEICKEFL